MICPGVWQMPNPGLMILKYSSIIKPVCFVASFTPPDPAERVKLKAHSHATKSISQNRTSGNLEKVIGGK